MSRSPTWVVVVVMIAAACDKPSEDKEEDKEAAASPAEKQRPAQPTTEDGGAPANEEVVADRLKIATDARIELFSVLFGFAAAKHYGRGTQASYIEAMGSFKDFAQHPAVLATIELRQKHGLGYEQPMKLAIYLDQDLKPIRPLDPLPPGLERWKGVDIEAYLEKVRAFAVEAEFAEFYTSQQPLRTAVEDRFRTFVADKAIIPWYDAVFGVRANVTYQLIPAFIVGQMNYGISAVHADGREDIVLVMFLENPTGKAFEPGEMTLGLLVHEFGHSYINRVFDARFAEIEPVFAPIFARVEPAMRKQAYDTPKIALNEAVVRAFTIMYMREKATPAQAARALANEEKLSFVWAGPLADALAARRATDGGKLSDEALFETTKATLETWAAANSDP